MIIENGILKLNRIKLIDILENNPEKSLENENIKKILTEIINKNGNYTSQKQFNWVLSKINFILKKTRNTKKRFLVNHVKRLWGMN